LHQVAIGHATSRTRKLSLLPLSPEAVAKPCTSRFLALNKHVDCCSAIA
jgi:hypothetical protein